MTRAILMSVMAIFLIGGVRAQKRSHSTLRSDNGIGSKGISGTIQDQKTFHLTLIADSSIDPKKVFFTYHDGKTLNEADTVGAPRTFTINKKYYSQLATVTVSYIDPARNIYARDFFVSDKPASITLHYQPNNNYELIYTSIKNAKPVFDTLDNKGWGRIIAMRQRSSGEVGAPLENFMKHNPNYNRNDSLRNIFHQLYKAYMRQDMSYLKQYPDEYFSFWFFVHQTSQLNGVLSKDKAFLQEQLTFLKTKFAPRFTNSVEGKYLIKSFEDKIKFVPLQLNQAVPTFTVMGIDGKKIDLGMLKGRYVLLDFWATWCGPCMAEIPFIKSIRQKYPPEKLAIIGISSDKNKKAWASTIKQKDMNWAQYLDAEKQVGAPYGVEDIPTLILLNKEGKMIYRSNFKQADSEALPKVLDNIN
jgi:thiol-disulfide isomerase/thioredoxin